MTGKAPVESADVELAYEAFRVRRRGIAPRH